jgi:transcriptional regulator with XRE-family HTH domain
LSFKIKKAVETLNKDNEILKSFGQNLRMIRQQKQLRQKIIAERCDMDSGSYSNIENGKRNITLLTLSKISKVLETPLSDLVRF